jgi:hypothetical protein
MKGVMTNRWSIAVAGVLLQVALGAVYAWSVFRAPLTKQFGWSISEVTLTFTISIFVLGITAFFGGGSQMQFCLTSLVITSFSPANPCDWARRSK